MKKFIDCKTDIQIVFHLGSAICLQKNINYSIQVQIGIFKFDFTEDDITFGKKDNNFIGMSDKAQYEKFLRWSKSLS